MSDFVSANEESLPDAGVEFSGEGRPTVDTTDAPNAQYYSAAEMDAVREEVEQVENPRTEDDPQSEPEVEHVMTDDQKAMAYAMLLMQGTNYHFYRETEIKATLEDCIPLCKTLVEAEKFFPSVNPVDPKWMAVIALAVSAKGFYEHHSAQSKKAKMTDVSPGSAANPQAAPAKSNVTDILTPSVA